MTIVSSRKRGDNSDHEYLPALQFHWLTSLYDPLLYWTLRESSFRPQLVAQARIQQDHHVLDLGCGTATLTIQIKKNHPKAEVVGLDCDPRILEIAQKKITRRNLSIQLNQGYSFELPFPDHSFDRVLSSLLFHHLSRENKKRTLCEVFRVLRKDGELHVLDWGMPRNRLMRLAFYSVQFLDGFDGTRDNVAGNLPDMMREAHFERVESTGYVNTVYGTLRFSRACKQQINHHTTGEEK